MWIIAEMTKALIAILQLLQPNHRAAFSSLFRQPKVTALALIAAETDDSYLTSIFHSPRSGFSRKIVIRPSSKRAVPRVTSRPSGSVTTTDTLRGACVWPAGPAAVIVIARAAD